VKKTVQTILNSKGKTPITALTAYDALTAQLASRAGIDLLLIGDSLGTTHLGFPTTVEVTLEHILHHTAAVSRAKPESLIVADLPFARAHYEISEVLKSCARLMQEGGAQAVKIEADASLAPTIQHICSAGIPIMGHIGLLPQRIHSLGKYRKFGKNEKEADQLLQDAKTLQNAGCFALIGEMIDEKVTGKITASIDIPLIGIGCGPLCDGQILVTPDMLGYPSQFHPNFVKTYANMEKITLDAFESYAREVRAGVFPQSLES
jgi:3-methyl-2-oxobutanoate hydroxymethyltransferase